MSSVTLRAQNGVMDRASRMSPRGHGPCVVPPVEGVNRAFGGQVVGVGGPRACYRERAKRRSWTRETSAARYRAPLPGVVQTSADSGLGIRSGGCRRVFTVVFGLLT